MIAMSLWDIKERLEYLCDSTFSVKRGLNELCKNPTRRVLCHFTIRRCVWLQLKKSHQSCIFGAIIDSLRYYQRYFLYFLQRRPNVPFNQKMDHDFPVINCTIISIQFIPITKIIRVKNWYVQKLLSIHCASFPYQGSQSDPKCVRSQYGSTIDQKQKKLIPNPKPQKLSKNPGVLKNRWFFRDRICHSMHPIIYRWIAREKEKVFLYFINVTLRRVNE